MAPMASIIVPTRGRDLLLRACLGSILQQTRQDIEVVVVDDASPEPPQLPNDPRITLIRMNVNGGPGRARNIGVQAAHSRIVAFCDDDDILAPMRLEAALPLAERGIIVTCDMGWLDASLDPMPRRRYCGDLTRKIVSATFPHVGQALLHKDDFVPFREDLRTTQDMEWWVRQAAFVEFRHTDYVGYLFRRHAGERVGVDPYVRYMNRRRVGQIHRDYFRRNPAAAALQLQREASGALWAGLPRQAVVPAFRALAIRPSLTRAKLAALTLRRLM